MASGPHRFLTSLVTCAALLLVLAADVRACPWLITTIAVETRDSKSGEDQAPVDPAPSEQDGPVAHGSTLPDEALPRNAPPPNSSAPRGQRDGGSPQLRGLDVSVALVLVRELPQYASLILPPAPQRLPAVESADPPHSVDARRAAGWLSSMSTLAPPDSASPR